MKRVPTTIVSENGETVRGAFMPIGNAVIAAKGANRHRGLTGVRRPVLTMGACSNLQILIEKCR